MGRQLGAGGRATGKRLAEKLDIAYYDKEILQNAAKESGLSEKYLDQKDEIHTNSFLYSLAMGTRNIIGQPSLEKLVWQAERDAIISAANENSCVIVGRCADYILRKQNGIYRIFIMADAEKRMEHIMSKDNVNREEAMHKIKKTDKTRVAYYNIYTEKEWGRAESYDLCMNTTLIETE